jgi:DNA-binding response OmpR family regulator
MYLRGVEQFKNREMFPYPDLLLLDFSMPRCTGMQVLQFLQRQFYRPHVVLWSNTLEQVSVPLALRLGADLVCNKPTSKRELIDIIRRLEAKAFPSFPAIPQLEQPEAVCLPA